MARDLVIGDSDATAITPRRRGLVGWTSETQSPSEDLILNVVGRLTMPKEPLAAGQTP